MLARLALAAGIAAGVLLAASFGTSMALCSTEQFTWTLLLALGFLLSPPTALAFFGGLLVVVLKLPACVARFGAARTLAGVVAGWAACSGLAWVLAETFGQRGCSILI